MKRLFKNKKGASAVLGVLLIILVTVTMGVFFYSFVSGLVDNMEVNLNTQLSLLFIETVNINTTCITAYIRNTGSAVVNVIYAYVNSIPIALTRLVELAPSVVEPISIYGARALTSTMGNLITFNARI